MSFKSPLSFENEKLEEKKRSREEKHQVQVEKQRSHDMKFLTKPFDHLYGDELDMVLKTIVEIMKKYYN